MTPPISIYVDKNNADLDHNLDYDITVSLKRSQYPQLNSTDRSNVCPLCMQTVFDHRILLEYY